MMGKGWAGSSRFPFVVVENLHQPRLGDAVRFLAATAAHRVDTERHQEVPDIKAAQLRGGREGGEVR